MTKAIRVTTMGDLAVGDAIGYVGEDGVIRFRKVAYMDLQEYYAFVDYENDGLDPGTERFLTSELVVVNRHPTK